VPKSAGHQVEADGPGIVRSRVDSMLTEGQRKQARKLGARSLIFASSPATPSTNRPVPLCFMGRRITICAAGAKSPSVPAPAVSCLWNNQRPELDAFRAAAASAGVGRIDEGGVRPQIACGPVGLRNRSTSTAALRSAVISGDVETSGGWSYISPNRSSPLRFG